jgi:hypothetical protein
MLKQSPKENLLKITRKRQVPPAERAKLTGLIYRHMLTNSRSIRSGNFQDVSNSDLGLLFQITDEQFFDGQVSLAVFVAALLNEVEGLRTQTITQHRCEQIKPLIGTIRFKR